MRLPFSSSWRKRWRRRDATSQLVRRRSSAPLLYCTVQYRPIRRWRDCRTVTIYDDVAHSPSFLSSSKKWEVGMMPPALLTMSPGSTYRERESDRRIIRESNNKREKHSHVIMRVRSGFSQFFFSLFFMTVWNFLPAVVFFFLLVMCLESFANGSSSSLS